VADIVFRYIIMARLFVCLSINTITP